jgi:polyhydroxyalkanoate synthase
VTARDDAGRLDAQAAAVLTQEGDLFARADPADFGKSLLTALARASAHPAEVGSAALRFGVNLATVGQVAVRRWLGSPATAPVPFDPKDRRFADPAWEDNPAYFALRQAYLAAKMLGDEVLATGHSDARIDEKAKLATDFIFDAFAPTNFLLTNPAALKRALETAGGSVAAGARNFLDDLAHNGGRPRQVDRRPFELGTNLAATPGKVVFRNDLMELIQYAPQTDEVHAVPLLTSPPWINKYYVIDLAPGRSFIEWAVQHRRTVFAISYRNPDSAMKHVTLDDYLIHGPRSALDVIEEITGASKIDIAGLCLGGALTAMTAAYLAATGDDRIGSLTLLNSLLDYSEPGVLGAFTDEQTVSRLEEQMAGTGFLDGAKMAATFDALRPNDLIFGFLVSNWLLGQSPPAFDILAWNADSTRMPAAMHSFYLRSLYIKNLLARGELTLAGKRLFLPDVKSDAYVVGAINDHIVPWHASYRATHLLGGNVRYALSSGGHIAGIVNPPNPKAWYQVADQNPPDAAAWRASSDKRGGSWWEDWAGWASERCGALGSPPPMGSERHPVSGDAPGEYVRG